MLTQEFTTSIDDNTVSYEHRITYGSGLFQGSQLNGAALTRGLCHINVGYETFFLSADASISLRNNHLTLKGFFSKRKP